MAQPAASVIHTTSTPPRIARPDRSERRGPRAGAYQLRDALRRRPRRRGADRNHRPPMRGTPDLAPVARSPRTQRARLGSEIAAVADRDSARVAAEASRRRGRPPRARRGRENGAIMRRPPP
jgi:hypothetical protein